MTCWPSVTRSSGAMRRGLPPGDPPEDRADRHPDATHVSVAENVTSHDFAGREDIRRRPPTGHHDTRALVHLQSEVRECDPRPQRVSPEWRLIERLRPMGLVRRQPLGATRVQYA